MKKLREVFLTKEQKKVLNKIRNNEALTAYEKKMKLPEWVIMEYANNSLPPIKTDPISKISVLLKLNDVALFSRGIDVDADKKKKKAKNNNIKSRESAATTATKLKKHFLDHYDDNPNHQEDWSELELIEKFKIYRKRFNKQEHRNDKTYYKWLTEAKK